MTKWLTGGALLVAARALMMPTASAAQESSRVEVGVALGPSSYDLSGTGTGFAVGAQLAYEPIGWLVVEPGVTFFTYRAQFDDRISHLFPELSVQAQLPGRRVRPFLGGGAGAGFVVKGPSETVATLHAAAGVRAAVGGDWGLRAELRVRSVRPWSGETADFLIGVSRRIR